ncbi:unnamed protein product [Eruca vesicaria subsp. sativa]|uniref:RNase H type-1 domain-containing protein n=1 Tax=Eruca vesicaria subsp. sativa TaxID=29727 RepID=A0ABC8IT18_ERUVS|nr:unnamed protein product [Eruca vesicaria subsp. sativa]
MESEGEIGGIGWSLFSREGIQYLQGSSSIRLTNTPIEAEAQALLSAVKKLRALRYKLITFLCDCKSLMDELNKFTKDSIIKRLRNKEAASMIHDNSSLQRQMHLPFVMYLETLCIM